MGIDPKDPGRSSPTLSCVDCGMPVEEAFGGIAICGDCLTARGSCCAEFGPADQATGEVPREYSSPPCYAYLFEEEERTPKSP